VTIIYVDGYNVILGWPPFKELSSTDLEGARDLLIDRLARYGANIQERVILVFDGKDEYARLPAKSSEQCLDVVFTTEGFSADVYIQRALMRAADNRVQRIVVTGDGALAAASSTLGAIAIGPEMFLRHVDHAARETVRPSTEPVRRPYRVRVEELISPESRAHLQTVKTEHRTEVSQEKETERGPDGPDA